MGSVQVVAKIFRVLESVAVNFGSVRNLVRNVLSATIVGYDCVSSLESDDVDDVEAMVDSRAPRGNRPIFECYWNGRLIPYTAIDWYVHLLPPVATYYHLLLLIISCYPLLSRIATLYLLLVISICEISLISVCVENACEHFAFINVLKSRLVQCAEEANQCASGMLQQVQCKIH